MLCQCQALEGVAHGVTQIQRLAQSELVGILEDDILLDSDAACHHLLELCKIGLLDVEAKEVGEMAGGADESVLKHFCIATEKVLAVKGAQETSVEDDGGSVLEDANLVLQAAEVYTRLAAYAGVNHSEEGSRQVDEGEAAFEGRRGKAAEIGHHTSPKVQEEAVARGTALAEGGPDRGKGVEVLRLVGRGYGDKGSRRGESGCKKGPAVAGGVLVGEDKKAVGGNFGDGLPDVGVELSANDDGLFLHISGGGGFRFRE